MNEGNRECPTGVTSRKAETAGAAGKPKPAAGGPAALTAEQKTARLDAIRAAARRVAARDPRPGMALTAEVPREVLEAEKSAGLGDES